MRHQPKLITTIKWGALLGAGLSLIKLLSFWMQQFDYPFGPVSDLLMIGLFILCLYMGIKEMRDKHLDGVIRFPRAFVVGIGITLVAFVIMLLYLLLHFSFIEKDALQTKNAKALERAETLVKKDTISNSELKIYYGKVADIIKDEIKQSQMDSVTLRQGEKGVELILNAYHKQLVESSHPDDSTFLRLDSFNFKAVSLLYKITRNTNGVDSAAAVIMSDASDEIQKMEPVWSERLAKMDIPKVESIPVAAAADALAVIIYGLLLDIFVALFLYRREKNRCSAQVEITPGRDRNLEETSEPASDTEESEESCDSPITNTENKTE